MAVKDLLKKFWDNKTLRNFVILIILIIIFIIVLIVNLQPPPPRKSERVVICGACEQYTWLEEFVDIRNLQCPKCGESGQMKFVMKCAKCDYEYPYIDLPLSEAKKKDMALAKKQRIIDRRCPNCGAEEVFPITNSIWHKKHHK